MDKRTFIKTSSILAGGAVFSNLTGCSVSTNNEKPLQNWSGNLTYGTSNVHHPKTIAEAQEIVASCKKIKALGSRHSFNNIADSDANQVSLDSINKVIALDNEAKQVKVEGGMRYGELAPYLHENGFALHNLASLPHITIAGAIATATHGSGINNGNLSTGIAGIEFINAKGELVSLSKEKDGDAFNGAVVGLGALGVVTSLTLDLLPTFDMRQVVYRNLPMAELDQHFEAIENEGYSVSLFTDWKNKNINEVWVKSLVDKDTGKVYPPSLFGAPAATENLHPIEDQSAENCTEQMGAILPWFEILPHFKMGFKPSAGKELQSEFFVPIEHAYEAVMAVEKLHEQISPHLFITELRAIKGDDLWMSTCYKRTSLAIHFTWKQDTDAVMKLIPMIEEQLAPFNVKPHWGKLFTLAPSVLQSRYEKLKDFKELVAAYDPEGKFRNTFLERNLYSA